jgi:hypothetical protein
MAALCLNHSPNSLFHTIDMLVNISFSYLIPSFICGYFEFVQSGQDVRPVANEVFERVPKRLNWVEIR